MYCVVMFNYSCVYLSLILTQFQGHVTSIVMHAVMCRGDTLRALRVADFFAGGARTRPRKVQTLTFASRRSKTNKTGTLEYMMMARHKFAERCLVGNVYMWLHWCLDIGKKGECMC